MGVCHYSLEWPVSVQGEHTRRSGEGWRGAVSLPAALPCQRNRLPPLHIRPLQARGAHQLPGGCQAVAVVSGTPSIKIGSSCCRYFWVWVWVSEIQKHTLSMCCLSSPAILWWIAHLRRWISTESIRTTWHLQAWPSSSASGTNLSPTPFTTHSVSQCSQTQTQCELGRATFYKNKHLFSVWH